MILKKLQGISNLVSMGDCLIMVTISKVKEIVTAAAIAVPIFWIGGKILRTIKDEISPSDDDEEIVFDDDDT